MRIVNRKEFLSLPENTLYSEYEPCVFGPLTIKMETLSSTNNDWFEQQIVDAVDCNDTGEFVEKLELSQMTGVSVGMDFDCCARNGCFDGDDKLYAVFEKQDIEQLIERLERCLST